MRAPLVFLLALSTAACAVAASIMLLSGKQPDDATRVEKICTAHGGHWERTGTGGACIDTNEF